MVGCQMDHLFAKAKLCAGSDQAGDGNRGDLAGISSLVLYDPFLFVGGNVFERSVYEDGYGGSHVNIIKGKCKRIASNSSLTAAVVGWVF